MNGTREVVVEEKTNLKAHATFSDFCINVAFSIALTSFLISF